MHQLVALQELDVSSRSLDQRTSIHVRESKMVLGGGSETSLKDMPRSSFGQEKTVNMTTLAKSI